MLYIVATPIGNLKDITLRALEVLKEIDIIACEDTRHTKILLDHYNIQKPLISYFQHSKLSKITKIIELMESGKSVALVTDAGTPGIADPGGILVDQVTKELGDQVEIIAIPGANAAVSALSISGFNTDEFVFYGFLPHKKGRQTKLKEIAIEKRVSVLYESPYRIKKLLNEILEFVGDREIVVCRELTKKFEEIYRGKVSEVIDQVKEKGEFVVIINKSD
ncbi:16S rRNA (cytidine(1402)-2'-O)-methyltransferase [bacterium (Candidatus Howlettbacteria) CG_4_10_14_0_8_um_filter_40_9]|nr:MAG: 16S rRNA (cytidine(1402)-2'-O)-methyltransferase [bacterium (Candidatus Howlettbacteria) CG_4_10_14_0_8_um_filter_40_9]